MITKMEPVIDNNVSKINKYFLEWSCYFMVFNATFNNSSVILWRSVVLVEETGVPGENHRHTDKRYHIMMYRAHLA
jgi:hypothetical protein